MTDKDKTPEESRTPEDEMIERMAAEYDSTIGHTGEFEIEQKEPEKTDPQAVQETSSEESTSEPEASTEGSSEFSEDSSPEKEEVSEEPKAEEPDLFQDEVEEVPEKVKKEQARLAKSWQKLESEKEEIRSLKQELEAAKERQKQTAGRDHTPEEYEALATRFEQEGKTDLAKVARANAFEVRAILRTREEAQRKAELAQKEFQRNWNAAKEQLIAEHPELKDSNAQLTKDANSVLKKYGDVLQSNPNGLRYAVELGKILRENSQLSSVKKELEALKAENLKLKKSTSVGSGSPEQVSPSTPGQITEDDVLRVLREADPYN